MLKTLNIENIAVIEKADVEFSSGLNVLTGETGAGKSIVVDSINAILGERTSKDLVRNGANAASVTAFFDDINESVKLKLKSYDLPCEDDDTLLLSRKISLQGKSTCRVNGVSCTVSMLKDIGASLVNIHGQHDSQALLNADCHYQFIDMLSDNKKIYQDYKNAFKQLVSVRRKLKELTTDEETKDRQLELLDYQISELTDADIKVGEWQELKKKKEVILNLQNIISSLNVVINAINGDDDFSGIQTLALTALKNVETVADVDDDLKSIYDKLDELNDTSEIIKDLVTNKLSSIDYEPSMLEKIEERLDLLYQFSNKYGETEQDMLNYLENAIKKRNSIQNADEELIALNEEYDKYFENTLNLADQLSAHRKKIALQLEKDVKSQLEFLDMPKIQFIVNFDKGNLSSNGFDKIEFLISTNLGELPKPLAKIASGGELSRIMLAIKNIVAKNDTVDTMIFDEIDTGVSGRASRKIGLKLKNLSDLSQVICVTHSAQIASAADTHFRIEKQFTDDKTFTKITPLDFEQRKNELARIMGGLEITDTLLKSAQELLEESKNGC